MSDPVEPARGPEGAGEPAVKTRAEALALLASIFLVAACGLTYELLIATVSSYLLGSSVTQFSLSIGLFVGSMGLGSWLSQRVRTGLIATFIWMEIALGLVGGVSSSLLFWAYGAGMSDFVPLYQVVLYGLLVTVGTLVGIELPLLVRVLNTYGELRTIVAQALSFDYLGCLVGSIAFPLVLLPALGLTRTAFLVGLVNLGVAAYTLRVFAPRLPGLRPWLAGAACSLVLGLGFAYSFQIQGLLERHLYDDEIIHTHQSAYQRIVLTRWREDLRLYLDGNLQFSSVDEHRYHETLVHPAMSLSASRRSVLVLGGGDGLAVREVLRHPDVAEVTLVDLDPDMTRLGRDYPALREQSADALRDPRVRVVNADAFRFLETDTGRYAVILADLPDPNGEALAKLYSDTFYRLCRRRLSPGGVFVTQATSPFFSRDAFWCVARTVRAAGFHTLPIHAYVPSFGDWGFVLAAERPLSLGGLRLPAGLRFLTPASLPALTAFSADIAETPVEVNTRDHPHVLRYYLDGSRQWN